MPWPSGSFARMSMRPCWNDCRPWDLSRADVYPEPSCRAVMVKNPSATELFAELLV